MGFYSTGKMILISVIVFTFLLGQAYAQRAEDRWIHITNGTDGMKAYLEKSYRELNNGNKTIWAKYVEADGKSSLNLMEFDCKLEKYRILEYVNYDRTGNVINSNSPTYPTWVRLTPESIAEALYQEICSSRQNPNPPPPEPSSPHRESYSSRPDLGVDYAIVTVNRANLREEPSTSSNVLLEIAEGDLLVLLESTPSGIWYNVLHVKSNQEGWIHTSTIAINYTKNRKPDLTIPGRETGSNRNPYVEVKNDSAKTMSLKIGETRYIFSPQESKTIYLAPGKYKFYASAPQVIPDFGEQTFQAGYKYTWQFYIITTRN